MCERGINRKYLNYTTVRTGRAHHAGNTTLSASFQTLCAPDVVSNKRNPGNGLFETSVSFSSSHVPAFAEIEPCLRFAALVPARYRPDIILTSAH